MSEAYNFNIKLKTHKGHEIGIDTTAMYGYFTRADGSEGGGLWFQESVGPDGSVRLELYDYDGVIALPIHVYLKLRDHPLLVVSDDFDPQS